MHADSFTIHTTPQHNTRRHKVLAVQAPQLSTFTILRASTLRVLRIRSPTLRSLRLDDLPALEALDVEASLLDSLELEKGT
jgi:hypothetical protein